MPSSHPGELTVEPVSRQDHLLQVLQRVPDPRKPRGRRHPLAALIAAAVCAVLFGAKGFTAIGQWAAESTTHTLTILGMVRGAADEATFRRTFARLDADLLDQVLGAWAATRVAVINGLRVISLDGKTLRGARTGTEQAPHLVAALCGTTTLGQVRVKAKSNEIPAVRDLLDLLDIDGAVVTLDAMHTQTHTVHIDDGFDFLGFRIQRHTQWGTDRRRIYSYPSDKAVKSVRSKVKALTGRQTMSMESRKIFIRLGLLLRGWTTYFRHGASKIAFSDLEHYVWHRVWKWLRRRHRRKNWRWIARTYGTPHNQWGFAAEGVELFNPAKVPIIRYRCRGKAIPTPWTIRPGVVPSA